MVSSTMGRDPSGRSRRISAMHSGAPDRRSTGRKDDQAIQGRDRTLGNISHTADGLRLQSQAYPHDAMMEELAVLERAYAFPQTRLQQPASVVAHRRCAYTLWRSAKLKSSLLFCRQAEAIHEPLAP